MRLKDGFNIRQMCGEYIVVAEGLENIDFTKIISLNASAALLWINLTSKEFTTEDAADILCSNYKIEKEKALQDAGQILEQWNEIGLIDE